MYMTEISAVRIACYDGYREDSHKLFFDLHVLILIDLVKLKSSMIIYKAKKKLFPKNLQSLFKISPDSRHYT